MKNVLVRYWPILFLFILWVLFSSPYLIRGLIPFPSKYLVSFFPPWNATFGMPVKNNAMPDVITQMYPWKYLTIESWKDKSIPLWNPYSFSGTPHAANYQTAVFSPINILFFILHFTDAWSVLILLQPLLTGLFMYLFLRSLFLSRKSSLLGSLSFMFCGFVVVWMAYGTLGYAILPLPILLYSIRKFLESQKWQVGLLIVFSILFSLLSGHFQTSIYLVSTGLIFSIYQIISTRNFKASFGLILFFVCGIAIAMPQLLLSFDAFKNSVRSTSFGSGEVIPWRYLVTLVAPDFYGNPVTRNDWYGHYAEWSGFIGVSSFLFSLYGIGRIKTKTEKFFWIVAIFSLLLATQSPLNWLLYALRIPVLATSAASRIIVLTSFSLSVLAAFGFERVQKDWYLQGSNYLKIYCGAIVLCVGLIWIILLTKPFPPEHLVIATRNFILPTILIIATLFLFVLGMFVKRFQHLVSVFFLLIVALEMFRFANKWMPFEPKEYVYPNTPALSFLQKNVNENRVFGNFGNEASTYFHIPSIEGYDALYQERYGELVASAANGAPGNSNLHRSVVLLDKHGEFSEQLLDLLGTRFLLHRIADGRNVWAYPWWKFSQYTSIYKDDQYEIFQNSEALPRAFLTSSYTVLMDKKEILGKFFNGIDLRRNIILEEKPSGEPSEGNGKANISSYKPSEVIVLVKNDVQKILFISDVFDRGWKAYVDDTPAPLYRADFAFRAVSVPEGEHIVHFIYYPNSLKTGFIFAFVIFLVLVIYIFRKTYENRSL